MRCEKVTEVEQDKDYADLLGQQEQERKQRLGCMTGAD